LNVDQEISLACKRTDIGLWDAHAKSVQGRFGLPAPGHLVFPHYRGKRGSSLRVSEQEARFAFVEALCQGSLWYSVEAPTSKLYQFTGKTPLSAQTDLAVHDENGIRFCNVEFKAKGVRPSAQKHFRIFKDLQKLLREPLWGLWFHLLESVNNSTINDLLAVMGRQIEEVQHGFGEDVESPGLTLHVCALRHGFSLQKDVLLPGDGALTDDELRGHLHVDLHVSRSQLVDAHNLNGWVLHRYGGESANKPN